MTYDRRKKVYYRYNGPDRILYYTSIVKHIPDNIPKIAEIARKQKSIRFYNNLSKRYNIYTFVVYKMCMQVYL